MPRGLRAASCGLVGGDSALTLTIAPTADLTSAVNTAITTLDAAGGGVIQLEAGAYTIPYDTPIYINTNNITIQGVGPTTVITCNMSNNQWAFEIIGDTVTALPCSNTTANQTQITLTTHEGAGTRMAGVPIMIAGLDSNGVRHLEANSAAADGNGTTGVITLATPLKYTLTSVTMRSYGLGQNVHLKNFKIVHDEAVTSHSFGMLYTYRCSIENIVGDGGGYTNGSMNFSTIGGNLYPQMLDCTAYDYNCIEDYGGSFSCAGGYFSDDNYGGEFLRNNFDRCGNETLTLAQMWSIGATQENCTWAYNTLSNSLAINQYLMDFGATCSLVNCHIDHNTLVESSNMAINCRNNGTYVDTSFSYNDIDTVLGSTFFPGIQMVTPFYNDGLEFIGNTIDSVSSEAMSLYALSNATISDNVITNCTNGIYPYNCNGVTVSGNTLNGLAVGVYLYMSDNIIVSGNFCNSCTGFGIKSDGGCNGVVITGNECKTGNYGMHFGGADDDVTIGPLNVCTGNSTKNLNIGNSNSNFDIDNNDFRTGTVTLGSGTNIVFGAGNLVD